MVLDSPWALPRVAQRVLGSLLALRARDTKRVSALFLWGIHEFDDEQSTLALVEPINDSKVGFIL